MRNVAKVAASPYSFAFWWKAPCLFFLLCYLKGYDLKSESKGTHTHTPLIHRKRGFLVKKILIRDQIRKMPEFSVFQIFHLLTHMWVLWEDSFWRGFVLLLKKKYPTFCLVLILAVQNVTNALELEGSVCSRPSNIYIQHLIWGQSFLKTKKKTNPLEIPTTLQ